MVDQQDVIKLAETVLEAVTDPEIPVLTVYDLGIIRRIEAVDKSAIKVTITPTYSGCPAMDMLEVQIKAALQDAGFRNISVESVFDPAWTTDWMTENGKRKLEEYGIAPPREGTANKMELFGEATKVPCPRCKSDDTRLLSQFGSTACKAMYQCNDCKEPFDYFKCH